MAGLAHGFEIAKESWGKVNRLSADRCAVVGAYTDAAYTFQLGLLAP